VDAWKRTHHESRGGLAAKKGTRLFSADLALAGIPDCAQSSVGKQGYGKMHFFLSGCAMGGNK
jgi:hypothetical protein